MRPATATLLLVLAWLPCGLISCRKKPPPKEKLEDILRREDLTQRALNEFTTDLRTVLEWRQAQPIPLHQEAKDELYERLQKVRLGKGLPPDLASPWSDLMTLSKDIKTNPPATPEQLRRGNHLVSKINDTLSRLGHPDLRL